MSAPPTTTTPTITKIFSLWKLEIFNCLLSIAMLGSMYGILQHYDGHRVSDWDVPINLSTLIAIFTVIFRTSLVFTLVEIIGQAKWKYFMGNRQQDPPIRRLIETSRFNDASQGLFSALKLIPTIIRHLDIFLAIIVIVISLGTGSFVQQAIQTQPCQFSTDSINASLPISRNITYKKGGGKGTTANIDAAISSALTPDNKETGWPISVGCSTGNCTFQNAIGGLYNTLGVCSLCTETSSLITSTKWTYLDSDETFFMGNNTLPNGLILRTSSSNSTWVGLQVSGLSVSSIQPEPWNPAWTNSSNETRYEYRERAGDLVSPEMRALSQWAFANVTTLTSNWLPTSFGYTDYLAATCTLYPCLRTYNASVTMGKLDEVLTKTVPVAPNVYQAGHNYTLLIEGFLEAPSWFTPSWLDWEIFAFSYGASLQAVESPCLVNNTVWTDDNISSTIDKKDLLLLHADPSPNGTRHVKIENITAPTECIYSIDLGTWRDLRLSIAMSIFNGSCDTFSYPGIAADSDLDCYNSHWLSTFYNDNGITTSDIFEQFQAFTERLSNKIRMGLLGNSEYIFGQTLQTTVCVEIDYRWLTFPTVLAVITSILLVWTMFWQRRGCGIVWKTSILPFLFYSERFVVQNGEDMLAESTGSSRGAAKEALMDLDQMQTEARQQAVRFNVFN